MFLSKDLTQLLQINLIRQTPKAKIIRSLKICQTSAEGQKCKSRRIHYGKSYSLIILQKYEYLTSHATKRSI